MYYLKARLFPTILTVIPFITGIFLLTEKYSDCIIISGNYFILLSRLLFIPAVFFLMVQINRVVAKEIFKGAEIFLGSFLDSKSSRRILNVPTPSSSWLYPQ